MSRPLPTLRIEWVKTNVQFGVIPLLTAGFWALVFFGGRWILKGLDA